MKKRRKGLTFKNRLPNNYLARLANMFVVSSFLLALSTVLALTTQTTDASQASSLRYDADTGAYSGLTFSFDPRLDKQQVERLHFDHWQTIMHQASSLLYESLNGRAHLGEVRVLIPYKWHNFEWPVLHKPGAPIITNRHLRFSDSDVMVGLEDPIYKDTPFSLQHDDCGRPGLNIYMPISFLEEPQLDERLRARQFVREFASHRWGLFKESGFRSDYMYPPFSSLAGVPSSANKWHWSGNSTEAAEFALGHLNQSAAVLLEQLDMRQLSKADASSPTQFRGYDDQWNECKFETSPASGLPSVNAQNCLPYLADEQHRLQPAASQQQSFNLMSADPFSYVPTGSNSNGDSGEQLQLPRQRQPVQLPAGLVHWRQLADSARWHFCGENFPPLSASSNQLANGHQTQQQSEQLPQHKQASWFEHNQRTANKQNKLCHERSAFDIIKSSDDFRRVPFSLPMFNRIPEPQFKFVQEMPPRVILAFEYTLHLFSSRRLDLPVLQAAVNKFLAFDLIPDSEVATIVFGQHDSHLLKSFERLDSKLDNRFTLFTPAIPPFDEQAQVFSQQELLDELGGAQGAALLNQQQYSRIIKGTCSFARLMNEVNSLLQRVNNQYDDIGADLVVVTSGLFVEDAIKIEEIVKQSHFRSDQHELNLIIYPATMLFDTKSRGDDFPMLDSIESDLIIRNRIEKLLLIQKLLNGKIHLVKEHLDSIGGIKMSSTLMQFYQIFEHISRGHSWDQTNSMLMLEQRQIESRTTNGTRQLTYQFELDSTISNELFVAFVDPRPSSFALKNIQLHSPSGQLHFTERYTSSSVSLPQYPNNHSSSILGDQQSNDLQSDLVKTETAFFAYRAQMGLAGFHLRPWHLVAASATSSHFSSRPHASGTWTLTASSDEQLQTNAILMSKTSPVGDTLAATCWIQTHSSDRDEQTGVDPEAKSRQQQLKSVKVFMKLQSGPTLDTSSVGARMEVHDEMGNIVQNTRLLDDGLGSPDITRNDQIHSQYVQKAQRPGFYKVTIEVTRKQAADQQANKLPSVHTHAAQDNVCCGSFVPKSTDQIKLPIYGHMRRQIYCGTFYVGTNNKLIDQRPPRINNLTLINVDQDQRQVTLRWFEPHILDALSPSHDSNSASSNSLHFAKSVADESTVSLSRARRSSPSKRTRNYDEQSEVTQQTSTANEGRAMIVTARKQDLPQIAPLSSRYEIKLFSDRDIMKRAFDAKHDVGFKFTEWSVVGTLPNASVFGGPKEVTLRMPPGRESIYFIAMKVYNNLGIAGEMSNIVQFYLRNNLTVEELESIYGQSTTMDADGNVYDKNGDLIRNGQLAGSSSYSSLLKGTNRLDGLSVLIILSVLAFLMAIVCISLVACLASSARRSLSKKQRDLQGQSSKEHPNGSMLAGSGSSMVSAETTPAASSSSSSCCSNDGDALQQKQAIDQQHQFSDSYDNRCLQQVHEHQQQQAQLTHSQMLAINYQYQQQQAQQQQATWPQHTIVNGYTYATVGPTTNLKPAEHCGDPYGTAAISGAQHVQPVGDLNQNGLGIDDDLQQATMSPVQSWPVDVLLSHYDKVKQARERNEAPPVMRLECLDNGQFGDGSPAILDQSGNHTEQASKLEQGYLMRQQQQQLSTYMINQQLQQQLSSVLKSKRQRSSNLSNSSSPALEGVRDEHELDQQCLTSTISGHVVIPPPPQYIYHTPSDSNHLVGAANGLATHHTDPSIYSQATNLQQVITSSGQNDGYHANQWTTDQSVYGSAVLQQRSIDDNGSNNAGNNFVGSTSSAAISEV